MNQQTLIGVVAGAIAVTAIGAVAGYQAYDRSRYAEVIDVRPATRTVSVPKQVCRDEVVTNQRPVKDPNRIAGTVAGAVVGGVIGSQVGGGTGKKLATVGGAVGGGYAGNRIQQGIQERNTYEDTRRVCDTVSESRSEQDGYDVTYRLDGAEHRIRLDYDPGNRIPVEDGELQVRR